MSKGILNKDYLQFITVVFSLYCLDCLIMGISALQTGQISNWPTGLLNNYSPGIQDHLCYNSGDISALYRSTRRKNTRQSRKKKTKNRLNLTEGEHHYIVFPPQVYISSLNKWWAAHVTGGYIHKVAEEVWIDLVNVLYIIQGCSAGMASR